jgi:hypothetical protein
LVILSLNYHFSPIGQHVPRRARSELDHADPEVGVVDVEVVGDAPHEDEVHALLLQLPGQRAGGPGEAGEYGIIGCVFIYEGMGLE